MYLGVSGYNFKFFFYLILLSKDFFTIPNSVDPDEMQHYAAFQLCLHCLEKYSLKSFPEYKGLENNNAEFNCEQEKESIICVRMRQKNTSLRITVCHHSLCQTVILRTNISITASHS